MMLMNDLPADLDSVVRSSVIQVFGGVKKAVLVSLSNTSPILYMFIYSCSSVCTCLMLC